MNRRSFLTGAAVLASMPRGVAGPKPVEVTAFAPLKTVASKCGMLAGAQVEIKPLQYAPFAHVIRDNFNMITPGNELKWTRLRPTPEAFNFADADGMMEFAQNNGLQVHGHNLCWNTANPAWFDSVLTKGNARQYLTTHITTVMKRYAGRIDSWDVVNEAVVPWDSRSDGLYPGIWVNLLGPEYVNIAFQTAAEADPKALRVMNLHHVEGNAPDCVKTQQRAILLLKQYIGRGVPIQAIGLESHLGAFQPPLEVSSLIHFADEVRSLGLQLLITELDVNDTRVEGDIATRDKVVARCYHDYLMQVVPAAGISRVIFWTPSDKWVWLNSMRGENYVRSDRMPHRAGLLDDNMRPKPAYEAALDAFRQMCAGKLSLGGHYGQ